MSKRKQRVVSAFDEGRLDGEKGYVLIKLYEDKELNSSYRKGWIKGTLKNVLKTGYRFDNNCISDLHCDLNAIGFSNTHATIIAGAMLTEENLTVDRLLYLLDKRDVKTASEQCLKHLESQPRDFMYEINATYFEEYMRA